MFNKLNNYDNNASYVVRAYDAEQFGKIRPTSVYANSYVRCCHICYSGQLHAEQLWKWKHALHSSVARPGSKYFGATDSAEDRYQVIVFELRAVQHGAGH